MSASDEFEGRSGSDRRKFLKDGAALAGSLVGVSALAGYAAAASEAAPVAAPKIHPKVDGDINFLTFAEYIPRPS